MKVLRDASVAMLYQGCKVLRWVCQTPSAGIQADRATLHLCCVLQDELFAGLKCQPGFTCSRPELSEDLRTLLQ